MGQEVDVCRCEVPLGVVVAFKLWMGGTEGELRCEIPLLAFEWFQGVVGGGEWYRLY